MFNMFKIKDLNKKRGFSFIELMISVSIFAFLSAITVAYYANFNNRIGVDTLAHQMAQFGHEAQVSALSVKRGSYGNNYPGYGLHFERASTTEFVFFADLNGDKAYTPNGACGTPTSECEKVVKLLKGVTITALCGNTSGGITDAINCTTSGMPHISQAFDIVFTRPNPDAQIKGKASTTAPMTDYSTAQVIISSVKGYKKSVQFYITGQVTVK